MEMEAVRGGKFDKRYTHLYQYYQQEMQEFRHILTTQEARGL